MRGGKAIFLQNLISSRWRWRRRGYVDRFFTRFFTRFLYRFIVYRLYWSAEIRNCNFRFLQTIFRNPQTICGFPQTIFGKLQTICGFLKIGGYMRSIKRNLRCIPFGAVNGEAIIIANNDQPCVFQTPKRTADSIRRQFWKTFMKAIDRLKHPCASIVNGIFLCCIYRTPIVNIVV